MERRRRSSTTRRWVRLSLAASAGLLVGVVGAWTVMTALEALPRLRDGGSAMAKVASAAPLQAASTLPVVVPRGGIIVCEGDSLTYGYVATSPFGGGGQSYNQDPGAYPVVLQQRLGGGVKVLNRGVPGDTARLGLDRWQDVGSGDLAIIMYGDNDAGVRGQPAVSVAAYGVVLEALVRRRMNDGARVILLAPPPPSSRRSADQLGPYRDMVVVVGRRTGAPVLDAGALIKDVDPPLQRDGLHLTSRANAALAEGLSRQVSVGPPRASAPGLAPASSAS